MTRIFGVFAVLLLAGSAVAGPKTGARDPAKPAATCSRTTVVGHKGGERQVTCVIDTPIILKVTPPTPAIVMVPGDGRKVVGRPRYADQLDDLPQHLR